MHHHVLTEARWEELVNQIAVLLHLDILEEDSDHQDLQIDIPLCLEVLVDRQQALEEDTPLDPEVVTKGGSLVDTDHQAVTETG